MTSSREGGIEVVAVAGARPNFMKVAPLLRELAGRPGFETTLVHTGQHYDAAMSESFFRDLGIEEPDFNLGVGSGSHAEQPGQIMIRFEPVLDIVGDPDLKDACVGVADGPAAVDEVLADPADLGDVEVLRDRRAVG